MANLVADYGSDSDDDSGIETVEEKPKEKKERLPPPNFNERVKNSVFVNPFLEAENARLATLEKHVNMTPIPPAKEASNVCYRWMRGKCKYGDKCKYTHFRDRFVQPKPETSSYEQNSAEDEGEPPMKKRQGLTNGLTPSKKVMNLYRKYQPYSR